MPAPTTFPAFANNAQGNDGLAPATFNGKLTAAGGFAVSYQGKVLFQVSTAGVITFDPAIARLVGGTTSFSIRNNANTADNLLITDAGAATVRNGLTVSAGGLTITAGGLTVTGGETVNGLLTANNGVTVNGSALTANAGATVSSGLTVSGTISCNNDLNLAAATNFRHQGTLGFFNAAVQGKQTVSGSRGGNAALASLLTALNAYGLVTDSSTA